MGYSLESLLSVTPEEVNGLLGEFEVKSCSLTENVKFFYIRFQEDVPRIDHFISKLCDKVVPFCLKRAKLSNYDPTNARRLYLEAKNKFAQPKDGKSGEPGELIVYFLLEGTVRAPKVFSKMSLKTNNQMHVHGADGVHLGLNGTELILYFGEAKLYNAPTTGITHAIASVKDFITSKGNSAYSQRDNEIHILSNDLDIPEGELRSHVLSALDPYSAERDNLRYVHTCFIGFDITELGNKCGYQDFVELYDRKAKSCFEHLVDKTSNDPILKALKWQFFFIPFSSVDQFRKKFIEELKA